MESVASPKNLWLDQALVFGNDVLVVDVIEKVGDGTEVVAKIRHCYTDFFLRAGNYASGIVKFVAGMGSWGNVPATPGETILVAVNVASGRPFEAQKLYEKHWQGNFLLGDIEGALHAVARFQLPSPPCCPRISMRPCVRFHHSIPRSPPLARGPPVGGCARGPWRGSGTKPIRGTAGEDGAGSRLPHFADKMMSRQDFTAFRTFARRHRAYVVVCTAEPSNPWPSPNEDIDSPFMQGYCLHGIYSEDNVSLWRPGTGEQIRSELNDALGGERIVFGPLDKWEHREHPQSRMLLFLPDGDVRPLIYQTEVNQRELTGLGLPWPFPTQCK